MLLLQSMVGCVQGVQQFLQCLVGGPAHRRPHVSSSCLRLILSCFHLWRALVVRPVWRALVEIPLGSTMHIYFIEISCSFQNSDPIVSLTHCSSLIVSLTHHLTRNVFTICLVERWMYSP